MVIHRLWSSTSCGGCINMYHTQELVILTDLFFWFCTLLWSSFLWHSVSFAGQCIFSWPTPQTWSHDFKLSGWLGKVSFSLKMFVAVSPYCSNGGILRIIACCFLTASLHCLASALPPFGASPTADNRWFRPTRHHTHRVRPNSRGLWWSRPPTLLACVDWIWHACKWYYVV